MSLHTQLTGLTAIIAITSQHANNQAQSTSTPDIKVQGDYCGHIGSNCLHETAIDTIKLRNK